MGERFNGKASFSRHSYSDERRGVFPVPDNRYIRRRGQTQLGPDLAQESNQLLLEKMAERIDAKLGIGNRSLPAFRHKDELVSTISANKAVSVGGETGSGKSTQLPQFLYEAGFDMSIILTPRQIIANNLVDRVREELAGYTGEVDPSEVVGVVHGDRTERHDNNKILFMTPNTYLKMEPELEDQFRDLEVVVMLDEIHEGNIFTEIATASASAAVQKHDKWHVVYASATHNSEKINRLVKEVNDGHLADVEIKGRPFKTEIHEIPDKNAMQVYAEVGEDHDVAMIFTSGEAQVKHIIKKTIEELEAKEPGSSRNVIFRPLYRELGSQTISRIGDPIPEGHRLVIVSTPAGMSGITIPGLTCVITDGTMNRSELDGSVDDAVDSDGLIPEGLRRRYMSNSEIIQEIGRAGRDTEGDHGAVGYVVLPTMAIKTKKSAQNAIARRRRSEDSYWLPVDDGEYLPMSKREDYAMAEIYNTNLQDVTLSTAATGRRLYELRSLLQNQVDESVLLNAEESLVRIGGLDSDNRISIPGQTMNRLPVIPELARGLFESMSRRRPVEQLGRAAVIAAIFDVDGLSNHKAPADAALIRKDFIRPSTRDDMMAELDIAIGLSDLRRTLGRELTGGELAQNGIRHVNYERVQKTTRKILRVMGISPDFAMLTHPTQQEEQELREDFTAGFMDLIYEVVDKDPKTKKPIYRNILGGSQSTKRKLSNRSYADTSGKDMLAAIPYYYESGVDKHGRAIKYDVIGRTFIVDPEVVVRHATANELLHHNRTTPRMVDGQAVSFYQGAYGSIKVGKAVRGERREYIPKDTQEVLKDSIQNNPGEALNALRNLAKNLKRIREIIPQAELDQYRRSDAPVDLSADFINELINAEVQKTAYAIEVDHALRDYMYSRNLSINKYYYPEGLNEIYRRSPETIMVAGVETKLLYDKNNDAQPYIASLTAEQAEAIEGPIYIDDGKRQVLYQIEKPDGGTTRVSFAHFAAMRRKNEA